MKSPSPAQRETVRGLLRHERAGVVAGGSPDRRTDAAAQVYEKLSARLSLLIGGAGSRALFGRSAQLAMKDFPALANLFLGTTDSQPGDRIARLRDCLRNQEEGTATEATVTFFATVLSLLGTFIGDGLTATALRGGWPEWM